MKKIPLIHIWGFTIGSYSEIFVTQEVNMNVTIKKMSDAEIA
jgi:hypothetical protein